jgi:tRNA-(ms[2]io[6]A)-hydroxylase
MLNLAAPTHPRWLERVRAHLDDVLLDHAHCEKKAAGAAIKLLFAYPQYPFMQAPLSALAREELEHFDAVQALLAKRGVRYRSQSPSEYGARLHAHVRGGEPERALDVLLVGALIEARSCERFKLLAEGLEDRELAAFYAELLASEARHHGLYVRLARELAGEAEANARLEVLARAEAEILAEPGPRPRLHS